MPCPALCKSQQTRGMHPMQPEVQEHSSPQRPHETPRRLLQEGPGKGQRKIDAIFLPLLGLAISRGEKKTVNFLNHQRIDSVPCQERGSHQSKSSSSSVYQSQPFFPDDTAGGSGCRSPSASPFKATSFVDRREHLYFHRSYPPTLRFHSW